MQKEVLFLPPTKHVVGSTEAPIQKEAKTDG